MTKLVLGWLLPEEARDSLLALVRPRYGRLVAHHVTLRAGVAADVPLPAEVEGIVLGVADDGAGVQAVVLSVGGTTGRWDGSTYHVTWSLSGGRDPVESNDVIREHGWTPLPAPRAVRLVPAVFPTTSSR